MDIAILITDILWTNSSFDILIIVFLQGIGFSIVTQSPFWKTKQKRLSTKTNKKWEFDGKGSELLQNLLNHNQDLRKFTVNSVRSQKICSMVFVFLVREGLLKGPPHMDKIEKNSYFFRETFPNRYRTFAVMMKLRWGAMLNSFTWIAFQPLQALKPKWSWMSNQE